MIRPLFSLLLAAGLLAAEAGPSASTPVVVVGGEPITVRELEDSLLAREGSDQLHTWLREALDGIDWRRLPDDAPVVTIGNRTLTRRQLALDLLGRQGAEVREELIGIRMVDQALRREGITIDDAALEKEWERIDKGFQDAMAAKGQAAVPFAQYLQASQGKTKAQLLAEPGFRMAAGLHLLVDRQVTGELTEADIDGWFTAHRARFDQPEAIDISLITIPYRSQPAEPEERQRLLGVMRSLHAAISRGQPDFSRAWQAYGKAYDPKAADGRVGWVLADGSRSDGGRAIPAAVLREAWAAKPPRLMEPVGHDTGVDLVLVHGRRPFVAASAAAVRTRVVAELVADRRPARTQRLLSDLRRATAVDYFSLPDAIRARSATTAP
jgi:hypothetical protein